MEKARRQREMVEVILKFPGDVCYDYEVYEDRETHGPVWLRESLGDEFFSEVVGVTCGDTAFGDEDVTHLKKLSKLEVLCLHGTQVTDLGLAHLKRMSKLRLLHLDHAQITDNGLKHLDGFAKLETLWLTHTQVTDEGIQELQEALPNCEIIR
jgi:hypothetical protein